MALTAAQRTTIRRVLGYRDVRVGEVTALENAMDVLSAEGEVEVEAILDRIADAETRLETVLAYGGIKRAEEVEFFQGGATMDARALIDYWIGQLASLLGVPVVGTSGGAGPVFGHARFG